MNNAEYIRELLHLKNFQLFTATLKDPKKWEFMNYGLHMESPFFFSGKNLVRTDNLKAQNLIVLSLMIQNECDIQILPDEEQSYLIRDEEGFTEYRFVPDRKTEKYIEQHGQYPWGEYID